MMIDKIIELLHGFYTPLMELWDKHKKEILIYGAFLCFVIFGMIKK